MIPVHDLVILLVAVPLAAGLLAVPFNRQPWLSRAIGLVSLLFTFALSLGLLLYTQPHGGVLVSDLGAWPSPFSISFIYDSLAGLMIVASSIVAIGAYLHGFASLDPATERRYYHPLFLLLIAGVNVCFLTGDLFNLFVAFEIALMASYALMCIGTTARQMRQAYKYVVLNLLASTIFVMGAGMTYGMFGTLNIADIARIVGELQQAGEPMPAGFTALGALLLSVFAVKGAFFPMWFWLPDTYYTCPIAIAGLFSGLLTKVGVYCVMRTFPMIFAISEGAQAWLIPLLAISAAVTMFLAVLGAVSQTDVRKILSIHVISQIGYMVFAITVGSTAGSGELGSIALAGCALFVIHNMVVKSSLFLCCGVMEGHRGTDNLDKLGGLLRKDVWLGVLFFVAAMSLVGLPPLSGFFGKLAIIYAGWQDWWWVAIFALLTSPLTLLSMLKIWSYGFWNPQKEAVPEHEPRTKASMRPAYAGIVILVLASLFLGFGAEPVFRVSMNAGEQLMDRSAYIEAVLALPPHVAEEGSGMESRQVRRVAQGADLAKQRRVTPSSVRWTPEQVLASRDFIPRLHDSHWATRSLDHSTTSQEVAR